MAEVLVIDGGGRGQALGQAMEGSPEVSRVEITANIEAGLELFSGGEKPFVVIGPEQPLVDGAADVLRDEGFVVFGAGKRAAQNEARKAKTVQLARKAGVVQPDTFIAQGMLSLRPMALEYVAGQDPLSYVIKADGLAAGKGVFLPPTREEARAIVLGMLKGDVADGAGKDAILFADRKVGQEVSAMVVVGSGKDDFTILPLAQDYKRLKDGDQGPNTGGMGAYAPVSEAIVSDAQYLKIHQKAYKLLEQMEKDGVKYQGAVMYMGLMMSEGLEDDESDLLEINVRFGDPETQVVLPLVQEAGVDVYRMLRSAAEFDLEMPDVDFRKVGKHALTICGAAAGYAELPEPRKDDVIHGLDRSYPGATIQLAGVKFEDGKALTSGGRVFYSTAVADTIAEARSAASAAIGEDAVHFDGMQRRTDIGP